MRHGIRWEQEKRHGGHLQHPQLQRGWYDCLLLFCGTLFCLISAYLQLKKLLGNMPEPLLPEYAWKYILSALAVLAVCYGSGVLRRGWMRMLPLLPVAAFVLYYYPRHRLEIEDGILYLLRMYVAQICRYYDCAVLFPKGIREQSPMALLFWLMIVVICLFVLAAAAQRMELMTVLPLAMLIAGIAVDLVPGWQSMLFLFAGLIVLRMYQVHAPERLPVRAAQLAALLCVCILTGAVLSGTAEHVVAKHDVMMERQLALEDAVLALPVWDLFAQDGRVTNDAPLGKGREVLSIALSDIPSENVYLKTYAADCYENGSWSVRADTFAQAASEQGMTVQEAGEKIWNLSREAGAQILAPEDGWDAIGNVAMALPKEYDYTITCRNFGKTAPLPYLSRIPEELTMDGDTAAEKPWTKRSYSGSLVMGGSKSDPLTEYLVTYYMTVLWPDQTISISKLKEKPNTEGKELWYSDFVWEQCADAAISVPAEQWLDGVLNQIGWEKASEFRAYFSTLHEQENMSMTNAVRLSYVPMMQAFLQYFGTYSRELDPLPAGVDPIDYFLNTSGEGYCVHFASAATLILQAMGIPARYASGYVVFPKDFRKTGDGYTAVVTDARAHAWVEVYLDGFGWVPYEVTPGFSGADAPGEQTMATDQKTEKKEQAKPDTPDSDVDKQEDEKADDHEQEKEKDPVADVTDRADDPYSGLMETKLLGWTIAQWLYLLIGLFAMYFTVCLLADGIRMYGRKQEQRIRQEITDGHYREAILRINRSMYRMLARRELMIGRRIRDDLRYYRALRWFSALREAAVDADLYIKLVRQAYFSKDEMRAEDAEMVYEIYQRCRLKRKERVKKENGTDIFRLDI